MFEKRKDVIRKCYSIPKAVEVAFNEICDKKEYNKSAIVTALLQVFIVNEKEDKHEEFKYSGTILD